MSSSVSHTRTLVHTRTHTCFSVAVVRRDGICPLPRQRLQSLSVRHLGGARHLQALLRHVSLTQAVSQTQFTADAVFSARQGNKSIAFSSIATQIMLGLHRSARKEFSFVHVGGGVLCHV